MARWVLHPETLGEVDYKPLLRDLGEDVVDVAKSIAAGYADTGRTERSIHLDEVTDDHAVVVMDPVHPDEPDPSDSHYGAFVELGTSDTPAHPTLKPALYRYRSG